MKKDSRIIQTTRLAVLAVLSCSIASALGAAQVAEKTAPGKKSTAVIDRPEVLVLNTELQPGAAIPAHSQNKMKFYLFLPITSGIELTIGSDQPVLTQAGQGYFVPPGVPYGMRNPGLIAASAFEVTVRDSATATGPRSSQGELGSMVRASFVISQEPSQAPAQAPPAATAGEPAGRGAGRGPGRGGPGGGGGGGGPISRVIDRAEVRVLRNEVAPGQVHGMHEHDDVVFHLLMAITPGIELTVGSEKPVMLEPGKAVFLLKGTQHAFRNPGTVPAVAYEVFINEGPAVDASEENGPGAVMALLNTHRAR